MYHQKSIQHLSKKVSSIFQNWKVNFPRYLHLNTLYWLILVLPAVRYSKTFMDHQWVLIRLCRYIWEKKKKEGGGWDEHRSNETFSSIYPTYYLPWEYYNYITHILYFLVEFYLWAYILSSLRTIFTAGMLKTFFRKRVQFY